MAGLLDFFTGEASPEQNAGLLGMAQAMLQASGPSRMPVGFGQVFGAGLGGMQQGRDDFVQRERARQQFELQKKLMDYRVRDIESDFAAQEAQRDRARGLQKFYKDFYAGSQSGPVPTETPAMQPSGPAGGIQSPTAVGVGGQKRSIFDDRLSLANALRAQGYVAEADAEEASALKFQPKVKDWKQVQVGGQVLYAPLFEDGTPGQPVPYEAAVELERANTGGSTELYNPMTGQTVRSIKNTADPNAILQAQTTMRGQNMSDARAREALVLQATKDKAPTEFQGKSAAFGLRATEADKILSKLEKEGVTNTGLIRGVAQGAMELTPFLGDKLGAITGATFNALPAWAGGLNEKQQQVEQARRDFVNAVLRQESGAAIGAQEFDNASKQYFPQPGDSETVIAQKARNRALAVQALQANAGRAALEPAVPQEKFTVTAPNGKTYTFPDQKSMNNFKLSTGIK